jgi:hypothetical protein
MGAAFVGVVVAAAYVLAFFYHDDAHQLKFFI